MRMNSIRDSCRCEFSLILPIVLGRKTAKRVIFTEAKKAEGQLATRIDCCRLFPLTSSVLSLANNTSVSV